MLSFAKPRLALLGIVAAVVTAAMTAPTASAVGPRYASPGGFGTACTFEAPCDIAQAVTGVPAGGEVIVEPGDYSLPSGLLVSGAFTVHGVAGQPRPRLLLGGTASAVTVQNGATLRYLEVRQDPASNYFTLYLKDATLDQVVVKSWVAGWTTVWLEKNGLIRSSVVAALGAGGTAVKITDDHEATSLGTLRNVTALAPHGVAVQAISVNLGYVGLLARNVIARGDPSGHSLEAWTDSSGATAKITVDYSNWLGGVHTGSNASVDAGQGNQAAAPAFVDAPGGDYRQAPGSATIDAGLNEIVVGPYDLDGDPREIGTIDIGADEFIVAPAATTGAASSVTDSSATLNGSVDGRGAQTSYHFEYGPTSAYGSTSPAKDAGAGGVVSAQLGLLSPGTTYHYRLVATNSGGATAGDDGTFTTAASTIPAPTSPGTTGAGPTSSTTVQPATSPPSSPFAGVKLVSTRLSFDGSRIALTLRCPAGTAGRCSGTTALSTRRRVASSRFVTVSLGRATFSIAAGRQAKVNVRVSRAGRRMLTKLRPVKARSANAARDALGDSRATVAAVTILRRR